MLRPQKCVWGGGVGGNFGVQYLNYWQENVFCFISVLPWVKQLSIPLWSLGVYSSPYCETTYTGNR